jgi:hypothetical protein
LRFFVSTWRRQERPYKVSRKEGAAVRLILPQKQGIKTRDETGEYFRSDYTIHCMGMAWWFD